MPKLIEFETDRLYLRRWMEADREPFAKLNADARVIEFLPSLLDRAASDAMVDFPKGRLRQRLQAGIFDRGWGLWAVESKQDRQFIGFVGLHIPKADLPFSPCVEIGWRLAFDFWGKGYASEAARGALAVGFDQVCLTEIVSFTTISNRRSRQLMERLGMSQDPKTFKHPSLPDGYSLCEHVLYRLSKEQWMSTSMSIA